MKIKMLSPKEYRKFRAERKAEIAKHLSKKDIVDTTPPERVTRRGEK